MNGRRAFQAAVMIGLYVLLANALSVQESPFIPGAVLAFHMIVVVIAGILFGPLPGALTGLLGGALTLATPQGSAFEFASIIPHALMGIVAGLLRERPLALSAASILAGHALNLASYLLLGLVPLTLLAQGPFWLGLGYEALIGYLSIIAIVTIYRIALGKKWH